MERKQTHIPYGFGTGLATVAFAFIMYKTGLYFKPGISLAMFIPFLAGIILNAMAYSKANDGYVTYGNVFGSCFRATMIVTLVALAYAVICIYALPQLKEQALVAIQQKMDEAMAQNPQASPEMIDKVMGMYRNWWNTIVIGMTIPMYLASGALFSVIGAAVVKRNGPRRSMA